MQNSLYVALSSQLALDRRMDTIADNVANAGTVGFKATGIQFEDVVAGLGNEAVSFTSAGETYLGSQPGPLRETGNPLDFAVQGDAWFGIQTPAGTVMTRDGRFTMMDTGELVTLNGYPVLDAGAAPIVLDPRGGPPQAGSDGTLRQDGRLLGAIGLYDFSPGENFRRYENSGIIPDGEPQPLVDRPDIGVVQGFVEESNVDPIKEITNLIQVQRTFEQVTALMQDSDGAMKEALRAFGS